MKNEYFLIGLVVVLIAFFYWKAQKKAGLSVQLIDSSGNLAVKGSKENPITSDDIEAVHNLLLDLINLKARQ